MDFDVMTVQEDGRQQPLPHTGVLWRVRRTGCGGTCGNGSGQESGYEPEGYYRRGEAVGRPVTVADERQLRGQVVHFRNCYQCHRGGEGGLGPARLRLAPGPILRAQTGGLPFFRA